MLTARAPFARTAIARIAIFLTFAYPCSRYLRSRLQLLGRRLHVRHFHACVALRRFADFSVSSRGATSTPSSSGFTVSGGFYFAFMMGIA
jgi:hypothetical protein